MRTDLIKIQKILIGQGRSDLGKLFNNAYGELIQSDSYGRGLFSYISTYKIHYSIENECVINKMTDDDKNVVNTAILKLYPHENHKPEIRKIEYVPHFNEEFVVESESLIRIDFEYVRRQSIKSEEKISSEDYEGSITNSRTLLESLLKYIIHERGKELDENGDLNKLFKIALKDFPFDNNHLANENFRIALRGATSIVNSIASLRNSESDAHGKSPEDNYDTEKEDALLVLNLVKSISEFILVKFEKNKNVKSEINIFLDL